MKWVLCSKNTSILSYLLFNVHHCAPTNGYPDDFVQLHYRPFHSQANNYFIHHRVLLVQNLHYNHYEDLVDVLGSSCAATSLRIAPNVDAAGFALPRPIASPAPNPITKATRPINIVAHKGVPLFPVVELALVFVLPVVAAADFTVKTKAP